MTRRPPYRELADGKAWDYFGRDDALGCAALIEPEAVADAARGVVSGDVFRLDLPLELPDPPLFGRRPFVRTAFHLTDIFLDDRVDNFYLQVSTQWDGLGHAADPEHGWYGGRSADEVIQGDLGIEQLAARGMAGRGVLADVARHCTEAGERFDPRASVVTPALLRDTLSSQNVSLSSGDVLLVRTGWVGWYLGLDESARTALAEKSVERGPDFTLPGLGPGPAIAELLWDAGVSMVAIDAPSMDPWPRGDHHQPEESAHVRLLARLGLYIGELFALDELASACTADGRWTFLFVSAPLRLQGALGSPANAVAIR